jgi:diguanylate cyclase (GGDEF)-like protein/putative nucleotidyltransferase with HDIG domain
MRDWETKRSEDISEYILVTHIICLLIFLMIVFSFYNMKLGTDPSPQLSIIFILFCAVAVLYIARQLIPKFTILGQSKTDELLLLIIIFPLTFAFLWYSHDFPGAKVLIIVPVIIAATALGKNVGASVATIASALLFLMDYRFANGAVHPDDFQTNLILASVTILLAWLMGGLMGVERDTQQELLRLADYDQLTSIYNHRYLQESLVYALKTGLSYNIPLSLVLYDIDQFKYYNEVYGFQKGDQILAGIGEYLLSEIREPYYAARYGSDEFMLVLTGREKNEALRIGEEIKQKIVAKSVSYLQENKKDYAYKEFSVSMGLAVFPADGTEALALIRAAENDLFRTKYSHGRSYLYQSVLSEISNLKMKDAFSYLQTFVNLINAKDRYTFGHSERVMSYALALADKIGLAEEEKGILRYGAYLHDIGKLDIEPVILNKRKSLAKEEWTIMKKHTVWGSEMIRPLMSFKDIVPIVRSHHENYDGTGYPDGLKGDEISLLARLIRIVDSFDAMNSDRPYRKAMKFEEVYYEIKNNAGTLYDPVLSEAFLGIVKDVYKQDVLVTN